MSKKLIKFGSEARKSIQGGVNTVVKAVQTSYGPKGRTSIISKNYGAPDVSNDGVTIAKAIELEGYEQLGVSLLQQAANKTNDIAGDGTSLTVVLSGALVNEGIKVVEAGSDPVKVRNGIRNAATKSLEYLNDVATPITTRDQKINVATISSKNREIGEMIADVLEKIGTNGVATVQSGDSNKTEVEVVEGMQFDKGYKSPYFVTDTNRMEAIVDKASILVTDRKVTSIQDVLPLIESMAQQGKKDLVLIAEDIEGEALATFVLNKVRGVFNVYAVQAPAFGDRRKSMLEDISILTGATFVSSDLGMQLKSVTIDDLGSADKVVMSKDDTIIVGGKGDKETIQKRADAIKDAVAEAKSDYDKEKLGERLAKLVGGVGVIKVGAATEVEMKELKYVIEDALNATKAAVAEGVVSGGAVTLVRMSDALDELMNSTEDADEKVGVRIFKSALLTPFRAIAQNAGIYDVSITLHKISEDKNFGYDFGAMTGVEDMLKAGIIDPVMVLKQAVLNSSSVAGSIITTEVAIVDEPKEEKAEPAPGGMGGMGGMGY
ncbi:MAG: chaperonin GroEL [Patescibacteria group bacterium]